MNVLTIIAEILLFLTLNDIQSPRTMRTPRPANPEHYPFIVQIHEPVVGKPCEFKYKCGGSLITFKHVLTTRDCGTPDVRVLVTRPDIPDANYTLANLNYIQIDPPEKFKHDLAVLELSDFVDLFNPMIIPAQISDGSFTEHLCVLTAVGWVHSDFDSIALRETTLVIKNDAAVERFMEKNERKFIKNGIYTHLGPRFPRFVPADNGCPIIHAGVIVGMVTSMYIKNAVLRIDQLVQPSLYKEQLQQIVGHDMITFKHVECTVQSANG